MLEIENVTKAFGGVVANDAISLSVEEGTIVGLIGPNGSGKTTLFNAITGAFPIDAGSIRLRGQEISNLLAGDIARAGIIRTFQQPRIYARMTALDNMLVSDAARATRFGHLLAGAEEAAHARARELLDFVGLDAKRSLLAGDLSFGQQKLLELAMALINDPELLLLDEPTAGIKPDPGREPDRSPQGRQQRARPHAPGDLAQHAGDHGARRAHLLPRAWAAARGRSAGQS
jgi:branched-chain amino acid transport system ATP-binding protein